MNFFQNLKFVVIDELHTYRGVFGASYDQCLKKVGTDLPLLRVEASIHLLLRTIANPKELAEKLLEGMSSSLIKTGLRRRKRPSSSITRHRQQGIGDSRKPYPCSQEARHAFYRAGDSDHLFATSRLSVEVLTKYLKDRFEKKLKDKGKVRDIAGAISQRCAGRLKRG